MNSYEFNQKLETLKQKSPAKMEVLEDLLVGKTDTQIAEDRGTAPGTVRKQISQLYDTFRIKSLPDKPKQRKQLIELFGKHKSEWFPALKKKRIMPNTPLTGVVPPDDPRYLPRELDKELNNTFITHTDFSSLFIRIKGSKGMGKSSLLAHLRQFLQVEQRHIVASVNLGGGVLAPEALNHLDKLLYQFTYAVAQAFKKNSKKLELPELGEHWRNDIAPGLPCTEYLHDYVFSKLSQPKTLIIDGIDVILGREPIQTQFFDILRSWNEEKMKNVSDEPIVWPHIIIAYSTEPYAQYALQNSPLNIGIEVELEEFTEEQILQQSKKYRLNWNHPQVKQLVELIGGHPELINRALYLISKKKIKLEELLIRAEKPDSPFSDYLREHLKLLQEHQNLSECFMKILNNSECKDEFAIFQLRKAGLIRIDKTSHKEQASCQLYQRYFKEHLEFDGKK